ncbi:hypothetical protein ACFS7Z_21170 [Pontibacter toksunensis]|uniref:SpoIIAA-like protein n=1 Tax=Pontibacter toksunensis TaxID=1332631 RepID=A0ABW6C0W4_9BACT
MLIYSGIITLDYNPATDVLATSMPDIREFSLSQVAYCLDLIVESIKGYDIKYLLLDSSKSVVEVEDEAYKATTLKFSQALMSTRLKKIARVGTEDTKREEKSAKVAKELKQELNLPIDFRNYADRVEAMDWLLETIRA